MGGRAAALTGFNVREHPVQRAGVCGHNDEDRPGCIQALRDDEVRSHASHNRFLESLGGIRTIVGWVALSGRDHEAFALAFEAVR